MNLLRHVKRCALSLTEVLVSIALLVLLVAILLPAVQRVRGAADKLRCANQLRQIGLALHHFHQDYGRLPPTKLPAYPSKDPHEMLMYWAILLPYVEQDPLWSSIVDACQLSPVAYQNPPHHGIAAKVRLYACPADERVPGPMLDINGIRATYISYIGVGGGTVDDGVFSSCPGIRFNAVTDGLANTLMIGERPPPDTLQAGWWYSNMIDGRWIYAKQRGPESSLRVAQPSGLKYGCMGPFYFGPGRAENPCDRLHFWSFHPLGANFVFADGSTRFLRYSAEPVMIPLATRAGGEAVEMPE